jgi:hypothetical protein
MEIKFPCGAKGRPEFCPDLCNYGEFCKIKEKKVDTEPRGLQEDTDAEELLKDEESDPSDEDVKIETYY